MVQQKVKYHNNQFVCHFYIIFAPVFPQCTSKILNEEVHKAVEEFSVIFSVSF